MTTIEDIIIAKEKLDHAAYEERTIGAVLSDGRKVTIAELRKAFESVCDKANWKNKWTAKVPKGMSELVGEAVTFFHGARPTRVSWNRDGSTTLRGNGYACD